MKTRRRDFLAALLGSAALPTLNPLSRAETVAEPLPPAALASDPRRPQYHFLPAANWMNDPNGPIYWNGNYHMFYQYNPDGAYWGNMHWGHAVSPDMVHWRHLPIAFAPTPGGPDANGCFTGTAVVQDGRVTVLYTGVQATSLDQATIKDAVPPLRETQCLAVSGDPMLETWRKAPAPVIAAPPPQLQVNGFRDPSPWRQGEWWYLVTASGRANEGGAVLLYRSKDLRHWEYMHVFACRDRSGAAAFDSFDPWEVWECPEFFALGEWRVLIFSAAGKTWWQSGKLDEETMTFHPEQAGILDYGSFYAAKTQLDKEGNRVVWGWIAETRPLAEYKAAGWAGLMSLPRILTVAGDGRLRFRVAAVVHQLRTREQNLEGSSEEDQIRRQVEAIRVPGCSGEILCAARRGSEPFELVLRGAETDRSPWLTITYDPLHPAQAAVDARPIPLELGENENLEIHLYADGSVMELFLNGQAAFVKRFYYEGGHAQDLRLNWVGSKASMADLSVWEMTPISPNKLTS